MDNLAGTLDLEDAAGTQKSLKLAERIAQKIGRKIATQGARPGDFLGTEADLFEEFGASRSTIREAIAILETEGAVQVRRGRNGGLFAAPPDIASVSYSLRAYFEFIDVTVDEVMETRRILNTLALRLVVERITEEDALLLLEPGMRYWALLQASHNPVLDIFARSARRFEILALLRSDVSEREYFDLLEGICALQERQARAILGGDLREALNIEEESFVRSAAFMRLCADKARAVDRCMLLDRLDRFIGRQRPVKKPEQIMYSLTADILDADWVPGYHLGSEQEMLERYGVGRSAFREAIRPMEQYGIVEMRTGRKSGLKIAAPNIADVRAESLRRLDRLGAPHQSFLEAYDALGAAAAAVAAHKGKEAAQALRLIGAEGGSPDAQAGKVDQLIAEMAGNRVLSVMLNILGAKISQATASKVPSSPVSSEALIRAIEAGDSALAYRYFLTRRRQKGACPGR